MAEAKKEESKKIKKPLYKKWWFWVIIGIVFLSIVGSSSDDKTDTPNVENQTTTTSNIVGDDVQAKNCIIKVVDYIYDFRDEDHQPEAGKVFVKVTVSQTNTSNSNLNYNVLYWDLQDSNGVQTSYMTDLHQPDNFFGSGELEPGETITAAITYEIDEGESNLKMVYKPLEFGAGDAVKIKLQK